jgi:hypothetical protein
MSKPISAFEKLHDFYKTHDIIAAVFSVTRQNVTAWKKNGIPSNRALEVEKKTGGKITAYDVLRG